MDNQFKNVKTHARLLSKAMWYEWRMKLQDGLKEGLVKIAEGMSSDDKLLTKQEELLSSVVPGLVQQLESLQEEHENLQAVARELAECDPAELEEARSQLASLDDDIDQKTKKIAVLRQQLDESETSIKDLTSRKQSCLDEIRASEKIREECRGWTSTEIMTLKCAFTREQYFSSPEYDELTMFIARVDELEIRHGWAITGIAGSTVSMTYLREIELVFDISSFQPGGENARIDLWYIGGNREYKPIPVTPEREFFLQCIRDQVRGLQQSQTKLSRMLAVVSAAWDKANIVANQIRLLNVTFPTTVTKTSDTSIAVKTSLVIVPLESKLEAVLNLHSQVGGDDVEVAVVPQASVVYGEQFKVGKVAEFLASRLGGRVLSRDEQDGAESWSDVVVELHGRLLARGRK
jgi:kinetochore protein Spc7/SPC105